MKPNSSNGLSKVWLCMSCLYFVHWRNKIKVRRSDSCVQGQMKRRRWNNSVAAAMDSWLSQWTGWTGGERMNWETCGCTQLVLSGWSSLYDQSLNSTFGTNHSSANAYCWMGLWAAQLVLDTCRGRFKLKKKKKGLETTVIHVLHSVSFSPILHFGF